MVVREYECEACDELLSRYRLAAEHFKSLTKRLTEVITSGERDLMSNLWSQCREAHTECNYLRKTIIAHLQTHKI